MSPVKWETHAVVEPRKVTLTNSDYLMNSQ
jgi:hypothetical protein